MIRQQRSDRALVNGGDDDVQSYVPSRGPAEAAATLQRVRVEWDSGARNPVIL